MPRSTTPPLRCGGMPLARWKQAVRGCRARAASPTAAYTTRRAARRVPASRAAAARARAVANARAEDCPWAPTGRRDRRRPCRRSTLRGACRRCRLLPRILPLWMTASLGTHTSSGSTAASKSSRSAVAWRRSSSRRASHGSKTKRRTCSSSARAPTRIGHLCQPHRYPLLRASSPEWGGGATAAVTNMDLLWQMPLVAAALFARALQCLGRRGLRPDPPSHGVPGQRAGVRWKWVSGTSGPSTPTLVHGMPASGRIGVAKPLGPRVPTHLSVGGPGAHHGPTGMVAASSGWRRCRQRRRSSGPQIGCPGQRR
mmetsp:Transcript_118979/g.331939  ORF Transcript_118979/g.331939 Transcript_118979/m.331939 type:complete len:313 (+) Transcript_118979:928-1866(+)